MISPTILITGAGGQLGSEFRDLSNDFPDFRFQFADKNNLRVEEESSLLAFFSSVRPAYCINCAAYTAVDKAEKEEDLAFLANGKAPGLLASVCEQFETQLIHISTDYVFDGESKEPYKEDDLTSPFSVYGRSKLEGEKKVLANNPDSIIIRTSRVYSHHGRNFVKTMLRLMQEKDELRVVNDQRGSPTYAADLARAIMAIIRSEHKTAGIFHYCNGGVISWFEFAEAILELSGSACRLVAIPGSEYPTPAKRPANSALDTSKIRDTYEISIPFWKDSLCACLKKIISASGA